MEFADVALAIPVLAWAAITAYCRPSAEATEIYFLPFWRLERPRSKYQQGRFHSEDTSLALLVVSILLGAPMTSSCECPRGKEVSCQVSLLIRALIPS